MGRNRSRSRSYSPRRSRSPPPPRRRRYMDEPRGYRDRSPTCSLLVRNIGRDARAEDLRSSFERFGPIKDVYLPKDYYSGEPRGFGFVEYLEPEDAADAQYQMDRQLIGGREITVVFAEESRKKPTEMRSRGRSRGGGGWGGRYGGGSYQRRSPRSPGHRFRSRSRSRSPAPRHRSSRGDSHRLGSSAKDNSYSPARRSLSKSRSPPPRSRHTGNIDQSPVGAPKHSPSPDTNGHSARHSWSNSPQEAKSPSH
ncbi:hypothetical protein O6H91_04G039500 [Diphasiastrum complanatum]|uniref:Uncharacterized protein n=1 Tax=Diphasiastrum complanatum TaxID=34168 RepID=A0ACC2DW59_DIPCM|nr:hypothetical protein O6H91_04G039500 [Diphasiastrum complanatum]